METKTRLFILLVAAISIAVLSSCSSDEKSRNFADKWTKLKFPETFTKIYCYIDVQNTDYTDGIFLLRGSATRAEFEKFITYSKLSIVKIGNEIENGLVDRFPQAGAGANIDWWDIPSVRPEEIFLRRTSSIVPSFHQKATYYNGVVYFYQNGPFDVNRIVAGGYQVERQP